MTSLLIIWWTAFWCAHYGVDPCFSLAVAHVESRSADLDFRTGLLGGKWYGPYNVHRDFKKKWPDIDTISGNCRRGVAALRGRHKRRVLQRYNRQFSEAYFQAVLKAERKYRRLSRQ